MHFFRDFHFPVHNLGQKDAKGGSFARRVRETTYFGVFQDRVNLRGLGKLQKVKCLEIEVFERIGSSSMAYSIRGYQFYNSCAISQLDYGFWLAQNSKMPVTSVYGRFRA